MLTIEDPTLPGFVPQTVEFDTHPHVARWLSERHTTLDALAEKCGIDRDWLVVLASTEQTGEYNVSELRALREIGLTLADVLAMNE
ncbi:MAG: hypothetical protein JNN26_05470 [Candidatus Obscuribacter sp.]|nr:hypothetical protein [Candidatus Obscuribacter sp.]